ncbi:MAG: hypothetical protein MZV64_29050 [Ignavibacteriales bacterium]|nr:hypothetical protein [Ignavibacteriales bacterium]
MRGGDLGVRQDPSQRLRRLPEGPERGRPGRLLRRHDRALDPQEALREPQERRQGRRRGQEVRRPARAGPLRAPQSHVLRRGQGRGGGAGRGPAQARLSSSSAGTRPASDLSRSRFGRSGRIGPGDGFPGPRPFAVEFRSLSCVSKDDVRHLVGQVVEMASARFLPAEEGSGIQQCRSIQPTTRQWRLMSRMVSMT